MAQFAKHFSIEEARCLIPDLRQRFEQIHALIARIRGAQENDGEAFKIIHGNGKGPVVSGSGADIDNVQELIGSIVRMGIQIKDLQRGLIDFPHFLHGEANREVFLCYELSEPTVEYWHEIDDGFSGRNRL
jgi:hypothetical protein